MGKYRGDTYYFIKLPDKFLNGDQIRWIEKQDRGAEIVIFYFRLLLIAKNREGKLARIIGRKEIPYTNEEIAIETYQTIDFVEIACELLEEAGLLEYKIDYYYIEKALELTNQTTVGAEYMQNYRRTKKLEDYNCKEECNTDIEQEKETEEKDKKIEKEIYENKEKEDHNLYNEIICYLNSLTNSNYKVHTKSIKELIDNHIKEGFTKDDFITVINKKYKDWFKDEKMKQYLRPETLFGDKFESYLNQPEQNGLYRVGF